MITANDILDLVDEKDKEDDEKKGTERDNKSKEVVKSYSVDKDDDDKDSDDDKDKDEKSCQKPKK
jgi:hypothetical protein